jgi:hypothetical protein
VQLELEGARASYGGEIRFERLLDRDVDDLLEVERGRKFLKQTEAAGIYCDRIRSFKGMARNGLEMDGSAQQRQEILL